MQPDLAYAYTLCGHEYSANDDFEKAMAFYRSAIRIDERHYNAWYGLGNIYFRHVTPHLSLPTIPISRYGLGNIYFRQEKFDFAEHHLRKALAINPCSSPLYCYLGMALHANSKPTQARDSLSGATNPGGIRTHTPIPIPTAGARLPERRDQHRRAQPLGTVQEGGGAHLAGRVHRRPLRAHHADRGRTKGGLGLLHSRKGARVSFRTRRPPGPPCARARTRGTGRRKREVVAMASANHGVVSGLCPTTPSRRLAERCPRGEGGPPHSDARPASRFPATPPWGERSMSLGTPPAS